MSTPKRHRIGYALAPKKIQSFIQPSLLSRASQHNIDLIPIDLSTPLPQQGPFDCVIHKMYGHDWKSQLEQFSKQNPTSLIIDSPDAIERLHNRVSMLEVAQNVKISSIGEILEVPKQVVVRDIETVGDALRKGGLGFPLLAKPLVADGSADSHHMYLIFDEEGLGRVGEAVPVILQEFVNHGGVIFKVYVLGRHVRCERRKSLPDVMEEELGTLKGAVSFSQISNLTAEKREVDGGVDLERVEMPPLRFVEAVARAMREELGLHLFNFDVIRDARCSNRYLVIDINYFPGFAKIPSYESVLTEFFLDIVGREEEGEKEGEEDGKNEVVAGMLDGEMLMDGLEQKSTGI